jgi:transposase InsO family protein
LYESIKILSESYDTKSICNALNVNRSSYLYWLKTGKANEDTITKFFCLVIQVYADSNGIYGSPKISAIINKNGIKCSVSKVAKAMHTLGIRSIVSKRFPHKKSTLTTNEKSLIVNLIKNLEITKLNQVWTTDITYIQTINEGTFYLISYIDYFSKKVISWGLYEDQKTDKLICTLKIAVQKRKPSPGLICHSDKGSQMRSKLYREYLTNHNFVFSYTSLNHSCDENAAQESFHASLKKEKIYQMKLYTYEDAYKAIYEYIEGFYNPIRIHSSIGYLSPIEFEKKVSLR